MLGESHPALLPPPAEVRRLLFCSGRVYFDLLEAREARRAYDVAIVRIEQLYPVPHEDLEAALAPYPEGTPVYWVQEEPEGL